MHRVFVWSGLCKLLFICAQPEWLSGGVDGQLLATHVCPACSHPLLFVQVQCEQEGMLLTAQEEGVTFLLSLPRNGS